MKMKIFETMILVLVAATILVPAFFLVTGQDIPLLGDSHVSFRMEDGRPWSKDFYPKDWKVEWEDIKFSRIVNPSPQSAVLELTNMETGQVFTVRHREILNGDHYTVTKKSLDGDIVSSHELIIR